MEPDIPISIRWNHIIYAQLLTDLLDSQMQSIGFKLLRSHVCLDHSWQAHETGGLVLLSITPSIALLAALDTIFGRFS